MKNNYRIITRTEQLVILRGMASGMATYTFEMSGSSWIMTVDPLKTEIPISEADMEALIDEALSMNG